MPQRLENAFQREIQRRQQRQKKPNSGKLSATLLLVVLTLGLGYMTHKPRPSSTIPSLPDPLGTPTEPPALGNLKPSTLKPVALPPSGVKKAAKPSEPVAQLRFFARAPLFTENSRLSTSCGGGLGVEPVTNNNHYYVELVDWQSGKIVTTAFVRSFEMVVIPVPYGTYKLRYAEGKEWYGDKAMFGSPDMYEMTEKYTGTAARLEFNANSSHDISVHCANGNAGRKRVTKSPQADLPTMHETSL
jgi:hypothetical protein